MLVLGIGNILQKDDGFGVYASHYLKENYIFKNVTIVNGGVEGINLLSYFQEYKEILILDTIHLEDKPASIYLIPAQELNGYGLNSGGAHEIGVLQCLDILELQEKKIPKTVLLGVIPKEITFDISLSKELEIVFSSYIQTTLNYFNKNSIYFKEQKNIKTIQEIIKELKCIY